MKVSEEKIIDAAYRLFKQRGIRSTRLQEVARACNTSLWEINLTFKSKKDLVLSVMRYTVNKKTTYLLINTSLSASAVTELNNFFKFVDDTINDLGVGILIELRRYHPLALDQLTDLVDYKLIPCLQQILGRGISEEFFRKELNSEQYASTYFFIIRTVLESERDWPETKKAIAHINDIFLHGALNVKGMRISAIAPN